MNVTPCEDCDNVHMDMRKQHPGRWICIKFPRLEGLSPIAPKQWVNHEPYMRCSGINGGHCPAFEPRRNGPKQTAPTQTSQEST